LPADVAPAISDTGGVVAYEATTPDGGRQVWIRDRVGATSRPVEETDSAAPGISGNGCVVAYSALRERGVELTVVDRCTTPYPTPMPPGAVVDVFDTDPGGLSAPALSFDGSTIVWSTGREIRRYVRPAAGGVHQRVQTIAPAPAETTPAGAGIVTGADVDVSADGTTVVFVAGPAGSPYAPEPANVYLWSSATSGTDPEAMSTTSLGELGGSDSTSPTISDDGTFVVFESGSRDLAAAAGTTALPPFVVGVDRTAGTTQVLVDEASSPAVSGDGNHVVYQQGDAVRVLSSDGATTTDEAADELAAAAPVSRLSISQYGRWLVFATSAELSAGSFDPATVADEPSVWAVDRRSSDLDVADTTSTTSTTVPSTTPTTPTPPTPPTVPGTTPTSAPTSTAPTTSPAPPTTSGGDVASSPTVPATTLAPSVVITRFPTTGSSSFPSIVVPPTTGRSFPTSSSTQSFTPEIEFEATAFASPVEFEPTVVDAGRRTAPVTLTNATAATVRVIAITVEVPGVFSLVTDGCSGIAIAPAASCSVEVQFSPVTVGRAVGSTTFQLDDGSFVTAALGGAGVDAPTLDLLPAVAGAGQTVTVFGAGFPAGSTVGLTQPGVASAEPIVVDADGTFAHVVVVLPNTPTGPMSLTVDGQPDVFDDVVAELLVSTRGSASDDAALRGGSVGAIRR
jgi:hypothetical protein